MEEINKQFCELRGKSCFAGGGGGGGKGQGARKRRGSPLRDEATPAKVSAKE